MNSFTIKQLRVTFILGGTNQVFQGAPGGATVVTQQAGGTTTQFDNTANTLVLTGLRTSAKVEAVARLATQMDLKIFGMKVADMNALTVAWANPPIVLDHIVILEANDGNGWTQVFRGTIKEAQPIYRAQPDVYFQVLAMSGYFLKINPVPPTSYPGTVDIGVAAGDIIGKMGGGFTYVDGGATGVLTNPYFYGTLWDQLAQACKAAKADFYIQGKQILIVPQGQPRQNAPAVVLNLASGLIGSPEYSGAGLEVMAIFNPAFSCGSPIQLETNVPAATGRWFPVKMQHRLDAVTPRGQWVSHLQCLRVLV